ncbi:flagellar hook-associated protein 1 [Zafaria cholistanensis]|uniref:Flagellar hook-associated protein 1 n=1 Tax=Zafaria cholistanensis TaxID=1682741 RepID=A0A5A7NN54_9MICC|nr:flagellar hook-associated protein FlgK [Zafaria cholistanensis]GER21632.1 flagellar hook-associated protein 1 [Zafaria cholistanensis]
MSTFGTLGTGLAALGAARAGIDTAANNLANIDTAGYTRQRVATAAAPAAGISAATPASGGPAVTGISRLADAQADALVRTSGADAAFTGVRAEAYTEIEAILGEPGELGLQAGLADFWAAWQDLSNDPGDAGRASLVLSAAGPLASTIRSGYASVSAARDAAAARTSSAVEQANSVASRVADLNISIQAATASGTNAAGLMDQRDAALEQLSALTGAKVRLAADGTATASIGGIPLVEAGTVRPLAVSVLADRTPQVEWAHRPGTAAELGSGELAGLRSVLDPASGAFAQTLGAYDAVASALATQTNAIHASGSTTVGTSGLDFFAIGPGSPGATLAVVPTGPQGVATGAPGAGAYDASVADAISLLGGSTSGPDALWRSAVVATGSLAATAATAADTAAAIQDRAKASQLGGSAVSVDEENVALLAYQRSYQAAARVITAVDEVLDVLINRTGTVGR